MKTALIPAKEREEWVDEFLVYDSDVFKNEYGSHMRTAYIKCPCGHRICWTQYLVNEYGLISEEWKRYMFNNWCNHIQYHIRMNGDKEHIELLLAMFEDEEGSVDRGIEILRRMAEKNIAVAEFIKSYIKNKKAIE